MKFPWKKIDPFAMVLVNKNLRGLARNAIDSFYCRNISTKKKIGNEAAWVVDTATLNSDSIVYSAGVGLGISFELDLVRHYGCQVFLYDPTPTAMKTMSRHENQSDKIHFSLIGFAEATGSYGFAAPKDINEGSFSAATTEELSVIQLECKDIATLMKEHGHYKIDLLKMDIEGFEYGVINHICRNKLNIDQICLEFHDFFDSISKVQTQNAIRRLYDAGYQIIHKAGHDWTFLRQKQ